MGCALDKRHYTALGRDDFDPVRRPGGQSSVGDLVADVVRAFSTKAGRLPTDLGVEPY